MIAGGAWAGVGCVCAGGFGSQTLSDKRSRGGSCIRERVSGVSVLDAPKFYIGNCHRNQCTTLEKAKKGSN